jgi:predicted nucleic acid-binding protein
MITIDASAIIKIIITEDDSDIARRSFSKITESGEPMLSPNIVLSEVLNGLWKHYVLRKDISMQHLELAKTGLDKIYSNMDISSQTDLAGDAFKIAINNRISIYDALYAALSIKMRAPLLTFDKLLKGKAREMGLELFDVSKYG